MDRQMTTERVKAKRWWRFDTRDLLLLTAMVAVSLAIVRFVNWIWPRPFWLEAVCWVPICCGVVGGFARQFRGGLVGALVGGILAAAMIVVGRLLGY